MEREDIELCQITLKLICRCKLRYIFYPILLQFDGKSVKYEIDSCRVQFVGNVILFVTSWDYDVGKISLNSHMSDVTMAFGAIIHA